MVREHDSMRLGERTNAVKGDEQTLKVSELLGILTHCLFWVMGGVGWGGGFVVFCLIPSGMHAFICLFLCFFFGELLFWWIGWIGECDGIGLLT